MSSDSIENIHQIQSFNDDQLFSAKIVSGSGLIENDYQHQNSLDASNSPHKLQESQQNMRKNSIKGQQTRLKFDQRNDARFMSRISKRNLSVLLSKNIKKIQSTVVLKQQMRKILENQESRRLNNLTDRQKIIINDVTTLDYIAEQNKTKVTFLQMLYIIVKISKQILLFLCKKIEPFDPQSKKVFFLQFLESIYIVMLFFVYTWYIFFSFQNFEFMTGFMIIGNIIFTTSSLQKMNTGYIHNGIIINDKTKIMDQYFSTFFIYDALAQFGLIYQNMSIDSQDSLITKILAFLVFAKTQTLLLNQELIEEKLNITGSIYSLMKLFVQSFVLCHLIGTMYHFLAQMEYYLMGEEQTWLHIKGIFYDDWYARYIESFYWAIATIMLVGIGGDTIIEQVFSILTLFGTVGMFAKILSDISMLLSEMEEKQKDYKKQKDLLTQFCNEKQFSTGLKAKLLNHLKHRYEGHKDQNFNNELQEIISQFPKLFQDMIKIERYQDQIKNFKCLQALFSAKLNKQIIDIVEEEYFMPNEYIVKQNNHENNHQKLILVIKGCLEIFYDNIHKEEQDKNSHTESKTTSIQYIHPGEVICEENFFTNSMPTYSVKSKDFSTVLTIDRNKFLNLLQDGSSKDKEMFHMQKDYQIFGTNYKNLFKNCRICQKQAIQSYHQEFECRQVHYVPNKQSICDKSNYSVPHQNHGQCYRMRPKIKYFKYNPGSFEEFQLEEKIFNNPNLVDDIAVIQQHQYQMLQNLSEKEDQQLNFSDYDYNSSEIIFDEEEEDGINTSKTSSQVQSSSKNSDSDNSQDLGQSGSLKSHSTKLKYNIAQAPKVFKPSQFQKSLEVSEFISKDKNDISDQIAIQDNQQIISNFFKKNKNIEKEKSEKVIFDVDDEATNKNQELKEQIQNLKSPKKKFSDTIRSTSQQKQDEIQIKDINKQNSKQNKNDEIKLQKIAKVGTKFKNFLDIIKIKNDINNQPEINSPMETDDQKNFILQKLQTINKKNNQQLKANQQKKNENNLANHRKSQQVSINQTVLIGNENARKSQQIRKSLASQMLLQAPEKKFRGFKDIIQQLKLDKKDEKQDMIKRQKIIDLNIPEQLNLLTQDQKENLSIEVDDFQCVFFFDFELLMNYQFYFPHCNFKESVQYVEFYYILQNFKSYTCQIKGFQLQEFFLKIYLKYLHIQLHIKKEKK